MKNEELHAFGFLKVGADGNPPDGSVGRLSLSPTASG